MKELTLLDVCDVKWQRNCPKCGAPHYYNREHHYTRAALNHSICNSCAKTGHKHSDKAKNKMSQKRLGKKMPEAARLKMVASLTGRKLSESCKQKLSERFKGINNHFFGKTASEEARRKNSEARLGKKASEETKKKMRLSHIERLQRLGIPPSVDLGAPEWFRMFADMGYNFIENYHLKELGYFADGYDAKEHIWMEYDTPYHRLYRARARDLTRQNNIIRYFESIGNPLNQFVRVDMTREKFGRMGIAIVYRGNKNAPVQSSTEAE